MSLLIKEYVYWDVSVHENQGYLGRCVVWCKRPDVLDLADATPEERDEFFAILAQLKAALSVAFQPDWFNYAFLGNGVRHLHCHVIPRYASEREFAGHVFKDDRYGHNYRTDHDFSVPEGIIEQIFDVLRGVLDTPEEQSTAPQNKLEEGGAANIHTEQEEETKLVSWWTRHAERFFADFTEEGEPHRIVLLNQTLLDMLQPMSGKRILDIGCGEGYLARMLASKGAIVTGIEQNTAALDLAHRRTGKVPVSFVRGNCECLPFASKCFDKVVSVLVLDCVSDIRSALTEAQRVLRPYGQFALVLPHPCFVAPYHGWQRDTNGLKAHWNVDRYFSEGMMRTSMPGCDEDLLSVHRTLTTYWNEIAQAGFSANNLYEPQPDLALLAKFPPFVEDLRIPQFLVFDLRKREAAINHKSRSAEEASMSTWHGPPDQSS